jgi:hypothetical protein
MLKALRRFTQLLRVHIYVPGCCKYIRMTNGLQPLVELCMDGCFADKASIREFLANGYFSTATLAVEITKFRFGVKSTTARLITLANLMNGQPV